MTANLLLLPRTIIPLKITKIGNSAGVILPKAVLEHLNAGVGETLTLVVTPRGIELSKAEPDADDQLAVAKSPDVAGDCRGQSPPAHCRSPVLHFSTVGPKCSPSTGSG